MARIKVYLCFVFVFTAADRVGGVVVDRHVSVHRGRRWLGSIRTSRDDAEGWTDPLVSSGQLRAAFYAAKMI